MSQESDPHLFEIVFFKVWYAPKLYPILQECAEVLVHPNFGEPVIETGRMFNTPEDRIGITALDLEFTEVIPSQLDKGLIVDLILFENLYMLPKLQALENRYKLHNPPFIPSKSLPRPKLATDLEGH